MDEPATYRAILGIGVFRALIGAALLTHLGETTRMLALSVLLYASTGSPLLAVLAYVSGFLPHLAGGLLLPLADRLPARTLMAGWAAVRAAAAAVLALGVLPWPAALALVVVTGVGAPLGSAAANAFLPDVVPSRLYVLGRSLLGGLSAAMQVVGFAAGGALLLATGPAGALWLTAAGFACAAVLLRARLPLLPARSQDRTPVLVAGWSGGAGLLSDRPVRRLLLAFWTPMSLVVGAISLSVPYAAQAGRPGMAGVLFAAFGAGMLLGGLASGRLPAGVRDRLTPVLALAAGAAVTGFLASPGMPASAVLAGIAGSGLAYELGLQERFLATIPHERSGQAFGLLGVGAMVGQAVAALAAGLLAERLGAPLAMALCGMSALAATALLLPALRAPADGGAPARSHTPARPVA